MHARAPKYLFDISTAIRRIIKFCKGKTFADYVSDDQLRAAAERQFEIIGEALNQLAKIDPESITRISDYRHIIAFRNVLIHGYAEVDDRLVWDLTLTRLPILQGEIEKLSADISR